MTFAAANLSVVHWAIVSSVLDLASWSDTFAASGRAISYGDDCGRHLCRVCGGSLQASDLSCACDYGLSCRPAFGSDPRHCSGSGHGVAFGLYFRPSRHPGGDYESSHIGLRVSQAWFPEVANRAR